MQNSETKGVEVFLIHHARFFELHLEECPSWVVRIDWDDAWSVEMAVDLLILRYCTADESESIIVRWSLAAGVDGGELDFD